jgi:hypothetical protein
MLFGNIENPTMSLPVNALEDDWLVAVDDGIVVVVVVGAVVVGVLVVVGAVVVDVVGVEVVVLVVDVVEVLVVDVEAPQLFVRRQLAALASVTAIAPHAVATAATPARIATHRPAFSDHDEDSARSMTHGVVSLREAT